ncbi:MAG: DoxX family protein [Acidithiobacillales bacterium SG8_45]|jgi:putative oxidoreductase|nr:MAG: DoxX family protein [Acidithiobacillales bacterium SG8_45]
MNSILKEWAPAVGRTLLVLILLISGFNKIGGFEGTAGYMASKGIPLASVALVITIIIEIAGAAMIIVGYKARLAAAVIFLWLIPVTFIFHAFWAVPQEQVQTQFIMFFKNIAMMGGMLLVIGLGSGPKSLKND